MSARNETQEGQKSHCCKWPVWKSSLIPPELCSDAETPKAHNSSGLVFWSSAMYCLIWRLFWSFLNLFHSFVQEYGRGSLMCEEWPLAYRARRERRQILLQATEAIPSVSFQIHKHTIHTKSKQNTALLSSLPQEGISRVWNLVVCRVQSMIDKFKFETEWEENHMVGVHVRRGDLTIWGKNVSHTSHASLLPMFILLQTSRSRSACLSFVCLVSLPLADTNLGHDNHQFGRPAKSCSISIRAHHIFSKLHTCGYAVFPMWVFPIGWPQQGEDTDPNWDVHRGNEGPKSTGSRSEKSALLLSYRWCWSRISN